MENIKEITIITSQGVKTYKLGERIFGSLDTIEKIKVAQLHFTGDPFDHYCGYNKDGKMLFSINCLAPCEVIYQ